MIYQASCWSIRQTNNVRVIDRSKACHRVHMKKTVKIASRNVVEDLKNQFAGKTTAINCIFFSVNKLFYMYYTTTPRITFFVKRQKIYFICYPPSGSTEQVKTASRDLGSLKKFSEMEIITKKLRNLYSHSTCKCEYCSCFDGFKLYHSQQNQGRAMGRRVFPIRSQ